LGFPEELEYLRPQTPLTERAAQSVRARGLPGTGVAFSADRGTNPVPPPEAG